MGERLKNLREKLMEKSGNASMLEVYGIGELLISGCRTLVDFDDRSVTVDTVNGKVTVYGKGLCVCAFRADLLSVSGSLSRIDFGEGEIC